MAKKKGEPSERLSDIFDNDPLGLLTAEESAAPKVASTGDRLLSSFQEILEFYEEHGRLPVEGGKSKEHQLAVRLAGIIADPKKVDALAGYDTHDLLKVETAALSIEEIMGDDPLGLLELDEEGESIFKLTHVRPTDRLRPDYIARRKVCKDFHKYEEGFKRIYADLESGHRRLVEFNAQADLVEGQYFVLRGVVFYLEADTASLTEKTYQGQVYRRKDGRTRCVFDNGTESTMLFRSLVNAMRIDGLAISDRAEAQEASFLEITTDDVQNGFVYVLRSKSTAYEIRSIKDLYKIGYCSGSITDRLKNAINEPTYLMSEIEIVLTARCYNMNARTLESAIHEFFGSSNVNFQVKGKDGRMHQPKEWYIAPMKIIEEAVQLIVEQQISEYKYDPTIQAIIKKRV